MRPRIRDGWILVAILALSAGRGLASEPANAPAPGQEDELARLRSELQQQQAELSALRQQVTASAQQDMDKARADEMRKQIRAILSEAEFRESLMPSTLSSGYDNGFFIRSTDDKFLMTFNGLMQFRYTHYGTRKENRYLLPRFNRDDRSGFDMQRLRFAVNGHVYSPDLTYHIEFKSDAPQQNRFVLDSGWFDYRFSDALHFMVGQFTLASTRTEMIGAGNQQFVDKPLLDAVYGLGTGIGARFWGQLCEKHLDWYFDVVNGTSDDGNTNNGRTITPDPAENDGNPALLARAVWHVMGDNPSKDFMNEADLENHCCPAWDLGAHFAYNQDNGDLVGDTRIPVSRIKPYGIPGGFALVSTNGLRFWQFGFDSGFKWMGWSLYGEYVGRVVDVRRSDWGRFPVAPWYLASGDDSTTLQQGAYVQTGYMLPIPGHEHEFELVARVGGVSVLSERQEGTWEYAAGMNYYIDGNRVKLQTDVTKVTEAPTTSSYQSLANVNDDALIFRVQLQLAF